MKNRKRFIFSLGVLALAALVGGVFAYCKDNSVFENIFGIAKYQTVNSEVFTSPSNWQPCESVPKTATIKNESNVPIVARIKYSEEWVASDHTTSLPLVDDESGLRMAIVDLDNTDKWSYNEEDGYYYYYKALDNGEVTKPFIESVTMNCDASLAASVENTCTVMNGRTICTTNESPYASAVYTLRLTMDSIQEDVASEEWGYVANDSQSTLVGESH